MASTSVFISYRRADTQGLADRLYADLVNRYGEERVFLDRQDIQRGDDWRQTIEQELAQANLVFALIGPRWLAELQQRIAAGGDDVLRFELGRALAGKQRVIPVLVDGAALPSPMDLPADLKALTARQAAALSEVSYASDLRQLLARAHVPWTVGLAWSLSTVLGWALGVLAMIFLMMGSESMAPGTPLPAGMEFSAPTGNRSTQSWPNATWMALSGMLLGAAVGLSQWLVLRAWLPLAHGMLWQYPLLGAALLTPIALAGMTATAQHDPSITVAVSVLVLLPVSFGLLLWWTVRRHVSRAGWFALLHHSAPILALLLSSGASPGERDSSTGHAAMLAVSLGSLVSGVMLVWLLRRAGVRRL